MAWLPFQKDVKTMKNIIWKSKSHLKHPFTGQNTQQLTVNTGGWFIAPFNLLMQSQEKFLFLQNLFENKKIFVSLSITNKSCMSKLETTFIETNQNTALHLIKNGMLRHSY